MISAELRASRIYGAVAFRRLTEETVLPVIVEEIETERRACAEAAAKVVPAQLRAQVRAAILSA